MKKLLKRGDTVEFGSPKLKAKVLAFTPGYYVQTHAWVRFPDGELKHVALEGMRRREGVKG